jgi:hypothetical protein
MAETYTPTQGMKDEAKRALEWIADGKAGSGFTAVGRKRANDIAAGRDLSADTVKRMYSFFARHEVDKNATGFNAGEDGFPSAGRVAWSAWGGDAGYSWSSKIRNQLQDGEKMASAKNTTVYSAILKMDEQPDGTLMVYGKATDPTIDSDEQICDPAWLKTAMPEWFKWGNVREQHGSTAAGVATEYKADGNNHMIGVHVVDAGSVAKVKAGVLKGFSIGIRGARVAKDNKAAGGRIIDGQIVEVSLVDRPANPSCTLVVAKTIGTELTQVEELEEKREVSDTEREHLANVGNAMPDESYPIKTVEDLRNAISSYGRAKDPAAVKQHIINRARELGAENELPEGWGKKMTATELVEAAKSFAGDITKFDQGAFDAARSALATLIQVEAGEMGEGSDETYSLHALLAAVHALFTWYEGEVAEGETTAIADDSEMTEMSDEPETVKDDSVEMCDKCNKAMDECKCAEGGYSAEEKADTTDEPAEKALTVSDVRDLVTDILKTLLPTTVGEDSTKSAEAQRIEALESELEQVKALAAPSNVKRMGSVSSTPTVDGNITKAQELRAKASATTNRTLAQGYLARARELENLSN